MEIKTVKVSDKGQISLPVQLRESLDIEKGDELLIVRSGNVLVLEKVREDDFRDILKHSEKVAEKLWRNKSDDIWDTL